MLLEKHPLVSVAIATFNSEKTLPLVLRSIYKQDYPRLEILVVDGGSQDDTLLLARKFGCRIIKNYRTEPVFAKYLAFIRSKGRYLLYLDHDEVLLNRSSIKKKLKVLGENTKLKVVIGSNYKTPKDFPFINYYINEFGDPFSFFSYRLSKHYKHFLVTMRNRYQVIGETKEYVIFSLKNERNLPFLEFVAGATMTDRFFFTKEFPNLVKDAYLLPHMLYFLCQKSPYIAITKNDAVMHYSAESLKNYLKKVKWRIKNNIFFDQSTGFAGFRGRESFYSRWFRIKKFLFVPYSFSLIFPILDSLSLAITRKKVLYFIHPLLCLYTSLLIIFYFLLFSTGYKPRLKNYDESVFI
jgi:glycosyltransferase involved in cell wall biosynthesis